jgi:hypothetical protein
MYISATLESSSSLSSRPSSSLVIQPCSVCITITVLLSGKKIAVLSGGGAAAARRRRALRPFVLAEEALMPVMSAASSFWNRSSRGEVRMRGLDA